MILGLGLLACAVQAEDKKADDKQSPLKSEKEKLSYAIGMNYGGGLKGQLKRQEVDIDSDLLAKGFKDALSGGTTLLTEEQSKEILTAATKEIQAKQMEKRKQEEEKRKVEAEKNKKEGAAFLAANKTKPGIIELPSGLQYKVIAEGKGESPKPTDQVTANYRGTLIDGTEFDSSYARKEPVPFAVAGVIKGWTEALQLMNPGAKWQLFVPAELAYGDMGRPKIPAGSTLIFEIELVSVNHPAAPAVSAPSAPLTSDIIKVPSAEELKRGAKIETIKPEDIEKEKAKEKK
ncbi:MAG: FKBP-type peptidyl-prolyl cis-trans isomerase [Pedosphaera sp.]|nr:FKBP-type peptidyl-prolyl cis-trans isomerase [Pedosphaera sp.]